MSDDRAEGAPGEHVDHDHVGHDHADHAHAEPGRRDPAVFRRLFVVCLVLTVPTLVFSPDLQDALGLSGPRFPGSDYIAAAFGLAVFALGGRVFASGAWAELRSRTPGTMTLISLALLVAFGYALAVTLGLDGRDFWWQLAGLVTILLLGHRVEMRAIRGLLPDEADAVSAEVGAIRPGAQRLADRAAVILFPVVIGAAALTFAGWLLLRFDDPAFVIERVVAVLVVASPFAFVLAIPLVVAISRAVGARRGIVVRNRAAFEDAHVLDVVLFDKSGVLTEGEPFLTRTVAATPDDEDEVLRLAAAVEARSKHPIARALVAAAREHKLKAGRASDFSALAGRGAAATVDDRELTVASRRLAIERGIRLPAELVHATREALTEGASVVYLLEGSRALAMFALTDPIRPESSETVAALGRRGIRVALVTGDSHAVAHRIAGDLGIDEIFAEVLPSEKAAVVARLQEEGAHRVAMIGDGVTHASALSAADLGIAIGASGDGPIESADVVLATDDPRALVDTLTLSRSGHRAMLQNLTWAIGYHVVSIPLAVGVLVGVGVLIPPVVAALLGPVSTVAVALNARRLERLRFRR